MANNNSTQNIVIAGLAGFALATILKNGNNRIGCPTSPSGRYISSGGEMHYSNGHNIMTRRIPNPRRFRPNHIIV